MKKNKVRNRKNVTPLVKENDTLKEKSKGAYEEINRLKNQLENCNYNIDKLELKIHKIVQIKEYQLIKK